jgi:hypothetical protein
MRKRYPQPGKTANSLVHIYKFQQAFPEKHRSGHESQKQDGFRPIGRRIYQPQEKLVHLVAPFNAYNWSNRKIFP